MDSLHQSRTPTQVKEAVIKVMTPLTLCKFGGAYFVYFLLMLIVLKVFFLVLFLFL